MASSVMRSAATAGRAMFDLDPFQMEAISAVERGSNVVVAAPTGAGKTVVAEHAISNALSGGGRAIYTTPLKALSNQKFRDLGMSLGDECVGLVTGDNSIRPGADVVVMTTEVLRNMLYAARAAGMERVQWVVLDEVHFLSDPYRGSVWEEIVIHAPPWMRFVCLSATISNADAFARWVGSMRGDVELVTSEVRPVPLSHWHMVYDAAAGKSLAFHPVNEDGQPNPKGRRIETDPYLDDYGDGSWGETWRFHTPGPHEVVSWMEPRVHAPGHSLRVQQERMRQGGIPGCAFAARPHRRRRAGGDSGDSQPSSRCSVARGERDHAGILVDVPHPEGGRIAPRRNAPRLQGGCGGVFRCWTGQGRLRYRNARCWHQHASSHCGH